MQVIIDTHAQQMPENVYLELCAHMKNLYSQVSEMNTIQAVQAGERLQDIAPWSTGEQTGRFVYTFTVPALVRSTTDVDLRNVYDYGLGGFGHRGFWYRTSADGEYIPLPMHLCHVDDEPARNEGTWFSMDDQYTNTTIVEEDWEFTMEYNEHNLSSDLRAVLERD